MTATIAVLLSNLTSPFYNRVASGVEQQATAEDRLCMVSTTGGDPEREVKLVETLREQNVDAVVLVGGVVDTPQYREHMARPARLTDSAGSRLPGSPRRTHPAGLTFSASASGTASGCHLDSHSSDIQP